MKATNVASTLAGIKVKRLPADAQRSLAQRMNAWAKQYDIELNEVEPTPKVASPVKPIAAQKEKPVKKKLTVAEALAAIGIDLDGPVDQAPTPIRRAPTPIKRATTRKPRVNTFYEDVIVGGYEKRAEAKPHKCEARGCYKYGHRFTDAGWFGTKAAQGHIQLASRFHKGR